MDSDNTNEIAVRDRYIDLLDNCLRFSFWPEPPAPVDNYRRRRSAYKKKLLATLTAIFKVFGIGLVRLKPTSEKARREGLFWPGYAHTMIGERRMKNLRECVESVLEDEIPGDFIETGVWRGGATILMRGILFAYGVTDRRVFVADSFEGLPVPEPDKYEADTGDTHHMVDCLSVSVEEVRANFAKYGLLDEQTVFLKGWFNETLPNAPIETLSILRLDGDMYGSTMDALTSLYPKLSPGGYCIIDDFQLEACVAAVTDYRNEHGIEEEIVPIDMCGVYWRKAISG